MNPFQITRTLPMDATDAALRADVLQGLTGTPKTLPPKWFYDAYGSELFEMIVALPGYYIGRLERELLAAHACEIAAVCGARTLVELGSGSSEKTRHLINALPGLRTYLPVDVSESALRQAGEALAAERRDLHVHALIADFTTAFTLPPTPGPRLVAFLGSTIGNLLPRERGVFLAAVRALLAPGDALLLGTDLVKDPRRLVAAYDDDTTGLFNRNVLSVINRALGADFDLDAFEHVALWDDAADHEWIEMRLRSRRQQTVKIPALDLAVDFAAGEDLRTEISAKFRPDRLTGELAGAGLEVERFFTSPDQAYALTLAVPKDHATGPSTVRTTAGVS
ncbi:L-histidine N(alpha)-methyltransferase [Streptomyces sp. NPDC101455]|uniref:L-histidine N(alpha)-methyltransferase n=1 Tax=Streptomyces sp. NPDC101455 TaxID=3366142 RepID=UPI0037F76271